MGECIHGFDDGLCAICFPPKAPEPPAPTAAPPRARSVRPTTRATGTAAGGAGGTRAARSTGQRSRLADAPPIDPAKLRVYHLTHLDNLARILGSGALLADAGDPAAAPVVDIAAPAARDYRRSTPVEEAGSTLSEYVPFFLGVDAGLWTAIRDGEADPRLAPAAEGQSRAAADFVLLVSSAGQALGARASVEGQVVVATSDASLPGADLAVGWYEAERILRRLAADDEGLAAGEFLVRGEVPLERIQLIAVANDRVRDRVRAALSAVGAKTRVAVYPPWFQASEA